MKRTLLTFTAALLLGSSASAKTEVTFLYGIGGELGKAVESMVKDFNDSQSDVLVRTEFGNNYEGVVQKALAGIAAGQPAADILHLEVSYVPKLANAGALLNVRGLPGFQQSFDAFWPVFKAQVSRPDKAVYSMPWNNSNPVMYFNPDLLKKAGLKVPPRTYPELREAARKIKAATGVPAIALSSFPWVLEGAVWSNNGDMIKNGRLALDQPAAREVLAISKNIPVECQQAAWTFINWLAQPAQQFKWVKMSNYVPITRTTAQLPSFRQYIATERGLEVGIQQLPYARPRPSTSGYVQGTQEIIKSLDKIFVQNAPVDATLKDLVDRTAPLFVDTK